MKTRIKVIAVILLFGVAAFVLGPVIWPMSADVPAPTPEQMPYFIVLSVFNGLFFGLGIAFILFGWPLVRQMAKGSGLLAWALYICIAFLMVSWWPHINLHNAVGFDLQSLLYIDYCFHIPLMIGGAVVAYGFLNLFRRANYQAETVGPVEKTERTNTDD